MFQKINDLNGNIKTKLLQKYDIKNCIKFFAFNLNVGNMYECEYTLKFVHVKKFKIVNLY